VQLQQWQCFWLQSDEFCPALGPEMNQGSHLHRTALLCAVGLIDGAAETAET
jgi:hypothetical protein